jgi:hypothetical protein
MCASQNKSHGMRGREAGSRHAYVRLSKQEPWSEREGDGVLGMCGVDMAGQECKEGSQQGIGLITT